MGKTLNITTLPEFDIGSLPLTQASIEKNIVTEHRPIAPITENNIAPIEIFINSGIDEYIQLRDTLLRFKMKINITRRNGEAVVAGDWGLIQPVNNFLHSVFKCINLEIEGKSVTMSSQTYAYKAFFENYLGYT